LSITADWAPVIRSWRRSSDVRESELRLQREIEAVRKEIKEVELNLRKESREAELGLRTAMHQQTLWTIGAEGRSSASCDCSIGCSPRLLGGAECLQMSLR